VSQFNELFGIRKSLFIINILLEAFPYTYGINIGIFDELSTLILLVVGNSFWGKWIIFLSLYLV